MHHLIPMLVLACTIYGVKPDSGASIVLDHETVCGLLYPDSTGAECQETLEVNLTSVASRKRRGIQDCCDCERSEHIWRVWVNRIPCADRLNESRCSGQCENIRTSLGVFGPFRHCLPVNPHSVYQRINNCDGYTLVFPTTWFENCECQPCFNPFG